MRFDIDNTTLTLLAILAVLLIYHRFFSAPSPLVHPLLLGKQSDVSAVRRKGETGIYRSFATGQGSPFAVRPAGGIKTVRDIAYTPKPNPSPSPRHVADVSLTDGSLSEILHIIPKGLQALFPNTTKDSPILTLIPPSTSTVLPLLLLQLSSPSPLFILSSPSLLTKALNSDEHPSPCFVVAHKNFVEDVVEQVWEDTQGKTGVLIIGDPEKDSGETIEAAARKGMVVKFWEDIWEEGETASEHVSPELAYNDIHSYFYSTIGENVVVTKLTHMNVTAGIAGLLSIFPADKRPTQKDVVASSIPLDTPFGMTIALASIYSGASFRFVANDEPEWVNEDIAPSEELLALTEPTRGPSPTILFSSRIHHQTIIDALYKTYSSNPLASFASNFKLLGIEGGDVSRTGWWEKLVWKPIRQKTMRGLTQKLRAVVVVGDALTVNSLAASHLLLGMPISRIRSSPFSAGPIFASHFYDLQCHIPSIVKPIWNGEQAHVGAPSTNVEVVLKGLGVDQSLEANERIKGRVYIRGPTVVEIVGKTSDQGWVDTEEEAFAQTNGTFVYGL